MIKHCESEFRIQGQGKRKGGRKDRMMKDE